MRQLYLAMWRTTMMNGWEMTLMKKITMKMRRRKKTRSRKAAEHEMAAFLSFLPDLPHFARQSATKSAKICEYCKV